MATRVCPQCGSQYVASVRRCIDCDVVLVDQPADRDDAEAPTAGGATPVNGGDEVAYELEGWSNQLKLSLEGMLDRASIRRVWEAAVLVVPAEFEAEVDALIATVEGVDVEDLDEDEVQVAFDVHELTAEELDDLDARLYAAGIAHAWTEELELLVAEAAADEVADTIEAILDDPEADDGEAAADDGVDVHARLTTLYVAVDKLVKDPLGTKAVARFLTASEGIDGLGVPYGLSGEDWASFLATVADLITVVQAEGDGDDVLEAIDAELAPRDEDGEELDAEDVEEVDEAVDRSGDAGEEPVVDRHGLARDLAFALRDRLRDLT
ncbi:MAG: hypothetical protein KDB04_15795 [Acidimicrobiales bacterium]|nr:hypothetical protein [Acidimicrobiales bacterium]